MLNGRRMWGFALAMLLLGTVVGSVGGFKWAEATLPTQDGTWTLDDWIRASYGWFTTALHIDYLTANSIPYINSGKNITFIPGASVNPTTHEVTFEDIKASNSTTTTDLYANTVKTVNASATGWSNLTDADIQQLWIQGENRTDATLYPETEADYIIWTDGTNYYAKNGHSGEIITNTSFTTLLQICHDASSVAGCTFYLKIGLYWADHGCIFTKPVIIQGSTDEWFQLGNAYGSLISLTDGFTGILFSAVTPSGGYNCGLLIQDVGITGSNCTNSPTGALIQTSPTVGWLRLNRVCITFIKHEYVVNSQSHCAQITYCQFEDNNRSGNNEYVIQLKSSERNWICYNHFSKNDKDITINDTGRDIITGNIFRQSAKNSVQLAFGTSIIISNNEWYTWDTLHGNLPLFDIRSNTHQVIFEANIIDGTSVAAGSSVFGCTSGSIAVDLSIINNRIFNISCPVFTIPPTTQIIHLNYGYVTENSGTATFTTGASSRSFNHGLSITPVAGQIMVTPTTSLGNCTSFAVTGYSSTQFTITLYDSTGAAKWSNANVTFAWIKP